MPAHQYPFWMEMSSHVRDFIEKQEHMAEISCQNELPKNDIRHINSYAKCPISVGWS